MTKRIPEGTTTHCPGCGGVLRVARSIDVPMVPASGDVLEQWTIPYDECVHEGEPCAWWDVEPKEGPL